MAKNTDASFEEFIGKAKKSSRGKWIAAGVIFVFFVLLIFISIDWVMGAMVHTRQEVQVPDITKKPVTAALNSLATVNLAMKQAGVEFADNVPPGSVLRQIPSAGSTVREGRVIRVWISQFLPWKGWTCARRSWPYARRACRWKKWKTPTPWRWKKG